MKIITVVNTEGIEQAVIREVICKTIEDAEKEGFPDVGMQFKDGEWRPCCWICSESDVVMIKLKYIDDGCLDEYLCLSCLKKLLLKSDKGENEE
jgi:hypothetical protein